MTESPRDKVLRERRKRGWSVRKAAIAGHISNTTWGRYESGELELSGAIRNAIAVAFGWPSDWPDRDVPDWDHAVQDATLQVTAALERLQTYVDAEVRSQLADHEQRLERVSVQQRELSAQVAQILRRRRRGEGPSTSNASGQ